MEGICSRPREMDEGCSDGGKDSVNPIEKEEIYFCLIIIIIQNVLE